MSPTEETPILERAVLDRLCADLGGRDTLSIVVRLFAETAARMLDELGQALGAGDEREVMRLAHSLKSSSRYVGAAALGQAAEAAEQHARTGEMTAVHHGVAGLHAALRAATAALEQELTR